MDAVRLQALTTGDAAVWRQFLIEYHQVFHRAMHLAGWQLSVAEPANERAQLIEVMRACRQNWRQGFAAWRGEGRFRAELSELVRIALHQDSETVPPVGAAPPALRWQDDAIAQAGGEDLLRLRRALVQLMPPSRQVVILYHLDVDPPSLRGLARMFGGEVEAVREDLQRGLQSLAQLLSEPAETVARWLSQLSHEGSASQPEAPTVGEIWQLAAAELDVAERAELEPRLAASLEALRELARADCMLAGAEVVEPIRIRVEIAEAVLQGGGLQIRPLHWVVLAVVALIGVLLLFDDGQPLAIRVLGFELQQPAAGAPEAALPRCRFRLEVSSKLDRRVLLLLVCIEAGQPVVRPLNPDMVDSTILAGRARRLPIASAAPFACEWQHGIGILAVSAEPAQEFRPPWLPGLVDTAKSVFGAGELVPATYRRLVEALTQSAQHDAVEARPGVAVAHVQWVDLRPAADESLPRR